MNQAQNYAAIGQAVARTQSHIEQSIEELAQSISNAVGLFDDLSMRLSSVKNEAPTQVSQKGLSEARRLHSCSLDSQLIDMTEQVRQLASNIRSARDGLCI